MSVSLAPTRLKLLTAVTTAANIGTSRPVNVEGRDEVVIYFISSGTTSGGTMTIEEADYDPEGPVYSGTWSTVNPSSITASSFTGGAQLAYHISPNVYSFLRVRVATDITGGGSVSVVLKMQ